MLIDHIGACLLETGYFRIWDEAYLQAVIQTGAGRKLLLVDLLLRGIGRIAFPIFCFFLVEGFLHTRDVRRYGIRLLLFALISEIPFDWMVTTTMFTLEYQNVYFTLLIGLAALCLYQKFEARFFQQACAFILCSIAAQLLKADYGAIGIAIISSFYLFRENRLIKNCISGGILVMESISCFGSAVLALPLLHFYDGSRGKKRLKYAFYIFYPAHILILCLVRKFLFGI